MRLTKNEKKTIIAHFAGCERANFFDLSPLTYSQKIDYWDQVAWFAHEQISARLVEEARIEYMEMVQEFVTMPAFTVMVIKSQKCAEDAHKQATE
jgi:hypothetical protein